MRILLLLIIGIVLTGCVSTGGKIITRDMCPKDNILVPC
jgi:hypothetical protein